MEPITVSNPPVTAPVEASRLPQGGALDWETQKDSYHAVRVLCDRAGLSLEEKNTICACIYQESQFFNHLPNGQPVKHENKSAQGTTLSTDWGLCQINDYWHIGPTKDFPTVQYVLDNPDKIVSYMIDMYQHNLLRLWSSYSSGAYRKWLNADSPMWELGG